MGDIIRAEAVSKNYGNKQVLREVDFKVEEGKIVGLLGPNGAGKTTFIRIMNGVIRADSGEVSIMNMNSETHGDEIRANSGIVTESAGLYHQMSGRENLEFFAALYGVKDMGIISRLLNLFELTEHQDALAGSYSTGMKKRLSLAKALLHEPKLLFLDEPTNGLDPDGIKMVLSYLKKYNQQTGTTILICSHVLHQLENICDSFAFLENGKIVEQGSKEELERKYLTKITVRVTTDFLPAGKLFLGYSWESAGDGSLLVKIPSRDAVPDLLRELLKKHNVYGVETVNNDLESIYFKVRENARK
ncbi:ABC transporter ATP-binding protein [Bacillus sp. FJAT-27251]|uniref:ABC transporter ATP-binding protein n=1 Tax=Bacillus sp. FJAT-27251 TaxID=1684142 RepID=UPI0006A77135|nr:ABC transporter ATP-binding protein [Bacillus sp. FJAT-27251]